MSPFGLWFAVVTALAAAETFHTPHLTGVAGLGLAIAAPMLTMIGVEGHAPPRSRMARPTPVML